MTNRYHVAASGKSAGQYVVCTAQQQCRLGGDEAHMYFENTATANEYNQLKIAEEYGSQPGDYSAQDAARKKELEEYSDSVKGKRVTELFERVAKLGETEPSEEEKSAEELRKKIKSNEEKIKSISGLIPHIDPASPTGRKMVRETVERLKEENRELEAERYELLRPRNHGIMPSYDRIGMRENLAEDLRKYGEGKPIPATVEYRDETVTTSEVELIVKEDSTVVAIPSDHRFAQAFGKTIDDEIQIVGDEYKTGLPYNLLTVQPNS